MAFKKSNIAKMVTIDNSTKPTHEQQYVLTIQFHTGSRYSYRGDTKKDCENKFTKSFGNYIGFTRKEWSTEDI